MAPAVAHIGAVARGYGFADVDGSQRDVWYYIEEARELRGRGDFNSPRT